MAACATPVQQGRKWIEKIDIKGAKSIAPGDLKNGLYTEEKSWWPFSPIPHYDPYELDEDKLRISRAYAERGFFEAQVTEVKVDEKSDRVKIELTVDEGPRTVVNDISIDGMPPELSSYLPAIKIGEPYNHAKFLGEREAIAGAMKAAGYAFASCEGKVEVDKDAHTAHILLHARSGAMITLGDVTIKGNEKIPSDKIVDLVEWRKGDRYDPQDIATTEARLYNQGVFSSVAISLDKAGPASLPSSMPIERDVTIEVAPGTLHELRFGGGIGVQRRRQDVHLRADWTIRNFLGGMRTLRLSLTPAFAVIPAVWNATGYGPAGSIEAQLTQPDIFGTLIAAYVLVGFDLQIQEGFQYFGPRVQPGLERAFLRDRLRVGVSYGFQYLSFFNVDPVAFDPITTPLGLGFQNPFRLAYFEEFIAFDWRDRPIDTRSGIYAEVRTEQGFPQIGSAFSYVKVRPEIRAYIPIHERLTLALRAHLGFMQPFGDEDASPVTRRFVQGGPSSHRGFSVGRLSPQVPSRGCVVGDNTCTLVPVGGHGSVLFSLDLRIRLIKLGGSWLGVVPFLDGGDVTVRFVDLDLTKLHWATGASLVYESPIGEVRVGLGTRLNRLDSIPADGRQNADACADQSFLRCPERFAFHLSIGAAF